MRTPFLKNFEAIAYDFDGTLADTLPWHRIARVEAFQQLDTVYPGLGSLTKEQHANGHILGSHSPIIIGRLAERAGVIPAGLSDDELCVHPTVKHIVEVKQRNFLLDVAMKAEATRGSMRFMRLAAAAGFAGRQAIGTTAPRAEVMPFLMRHKVHRYFMDRLIVTAEDVPEGRLKPAPDVYDIIMDRLSIKYRADLLVFEDTNHGVEAAKKAGATVVALEYTNTAEHFDVPLWRPDRILPTFDEAAELAFAQ